MFECWHMVWCPIEEIIRKTSENENSVVITNEVKVDNADSEALQLVLVVVSIINLATIVFTAYKKATKKKYMARGVEMHKIGVATPAANSGV